MQILRFSGNLLPNITCKAECYIESVSVMSHHQQHLSNKLLLPMDMLTQILSDKKLSCWQAIFK